MPAPPSQADLEALAERALAHVAGEGQATAWWERGADNSGGLRCWDAVHVEVAALGGGVVQTDATSDDALRAAAAAAARLEPGPGEPRALPDPAPGRTHDGYDPAAAMDAAQAAEAIAALPPASRWRTAATKIAIASTRGVRAYEQRSHTELTLLPSLVSAAATGPSGLDPAALAAEFLELAGQAGGEEPLSPGERAVVLGPWAVARLLEDAAWQFGAAAASPFGDSLGKRIVAPAINLSDSPRFARTLPRSYDAEGAPVSPVPLIQDGVAHRVVHDASTAAQAGATTTGHASRPAGTGSPRPRNFVLVGGGAAGVAELAAGIGDGVLITSLSRGRDRWRAHGVRPIAGGELGPPAADADVHADAFAVLAATKALTGRQWLVPAATVRPLRDAAASVVPALRARGGVTIL